MADFLRGGVRPCMWYFLRPCGVRVIHSVRFVQLLRCARKGTRSHDEYNLFATSLFDRWHHSTDYQLRETCSFNCIGTVGFYSLSVRQHKRYEHTVKHTCMYIRLTDNIIIKSCTFISRIILHCYSFKFNRDINILSLIIYIHHNTTQTKGQTLRAYC